jgi:hypothetical protein
MILGKILADDKKVDDYKISEKDFLVVMVSKVIIDSIEEEERAQINVIQ